MTDSTASPGLTTEQLADAGDAAPTSADQGGRAPMTATADRAQPAADASTDVTTLGEPARGAGASQPLLANGAAFTSRWTEIQTMFVDEPRTAVEQADTLVAEVIRELARVFAEERGQLESAWSRGTDVSTEDLRQALQRYRDFFHVLLRS